MSKLLRSALLVSLAVIAGPGIAHAAILGPDAATCETDKAPAVLVRVAGFKAHTGILRVQVYGSDPADFLARGRKLKRIDLPVTQHGPMKVCVALPTPGDYAVAVRHDVSGTGKSDWSDGGGFSRNPNLSLLSLKPKYRDVVITVGAQPLAIDVVLNYRQGLSIKPIAMAGR